MAAEAWARGWTALTHHDRVDLRLADAFVQHVFEQQDASRYVLAASAYLAMLAHLDARSPAMDALRARHLAPLALILPDHVRQEIGLAEAEEAATAALSEGAGARLVAWWRRMDPLPATPQNERLVEHLERVVYARAHFADERSALGFDDRGKVYIRLGAPSHQTSIPYPPPARRARKPDRSPGPRHPP